MTKRVIRGGSFLCSESYCMSYRPSARKLVALCAAVVMTVPASHARDAKERPNILWLVSEDNSSYYVGSYGDPLARTPNIDRLARAGTIFRTAHATAPVCSVSRASIITGIYASSLGLQHHRSTHPLPASVRYFPEYLRAAGYFTVNNDKTDYNTPPPYDRAWNENNRAAHWRHRAPGQPFFAMFNFLQSHESSVYNRRPLITDPAKVRVPAYSPDTPEVRADIAQYYDSVAQADAKIGQILRQLEDDGLAEDTIVFYFSDHGGAVSGSKRFLLNHGTQIPLVTRFPRKYRHLAPKATNGWFEELVSAVDLAPTVLSLAEVALPPQLQGRALAGPARAAAPSYVFATRDRLDERYDLTRAVIDGRYRYLRHFRPDLIDGRRFWSLSSASMSEWRRLWKQGKLNAKQRAFFEAKPPEQLFDCLADPDNVRNLADDPQYADVLVRMRAALHEHLLFIRDTGFMPEPLMDELAAGRTPTVISSDESAYPLAQLLEFIDAVQLERETTGKQLEAALQHRLPVFRYWAVVMTSINDTDLLALLLKDPNPVVRVAAAEALVRGGRTSVDEAWKEVIAALAPENIHSLHLTAGNIVADFSSGSPAALAALRNLVPNAPSAVDTSQSHPDLAGMQMLYDLAGLLETAEGKSNQFTRAFQENMKTLQDDAKDARP